METLVQIRAPDALSQCRDISVVRCVESFLESLDEAKIGDAEVTVLCEEPRLAYDRVHLSEFSAGKSAADLSLVSPDFFDRDNLPLKLNTRATGIERNNTTVTVSTGENLFSCSIFSTSICCPAYLY